MKFRSRVAAVAAAAGLAAGLLIVGGGGTAQAQTTFLDCDKISGTGTIKDGDLLNPPAVNGLTNVASPVVISVKSNSTTVAPGQYPRTCTGSLAAIGGPVTKVSGKLTGTTSCASTPGPTTSDPVDGKLDLTYTNFDPLFKQYKSSSYIRLGAGATLDTFGISNGIVTKGLGVGMDVVGDLLQAPVILKPPVGTAYSTLAADGTIVSGADSLALGLNCSIGLATISNVLFSTDGTSLLGPVVNSSISLQLP